MLLKTQAKIEPNSKTKNMVIHLVLLEHRKAFET